MTGHWTSLWRWCRTLAKHLQNGGDNVHHTYKIVSSVVTQNWFFVYIRNLDSSESWTLKCPQSGRFGNRLRNVTIQILNIVFWFSIYSVLWIWSTILVRSKYVRPTVFWDCKINFFFSHRHSTSRKQERSGRGERSHISGSKPVTHRLKLVGIWILETYHNCIFTCLIFWFQMVCIQTKVHKLIQHK